MRRRRVQPVVAIALAAIGVTGCGDTATQLMVVVDTDMQVPDELDAVQLSVAGPAGREQLFDVPLTGSGAVELPLLLGLVPDSDALAPVEVQAWGMARGTSVVLRRIRTGFVEGEIRVVRLNLLRSCLGSDCGMGLTCTLNGCESAEIPGSSLPPWTGPPGRLGTGDGGVPVDGGSTCEPGFADCDGRKENGCEGDLSSAATCGDCTTQCSGGTPLCDAAGEGGCAATCSSPTMQCGDACVDITTHPLHCGECDRQCPTRPNASPTCGVSNCGFTCDSGWENCNGTSDDGCEASLSTIDDCGVCGALCAPGRATGTCATGTCEIVACDPGFGDCDADGANGCEADLATDAANCGSCGRDCARGRVCSDGACVDRSRVVQIVAGISHTCARIGTGEVLCWGANSDGQLGDVSTTAKPTPTSVTGISDAIDIAVGVGRPGSSARSHSCAVRAGGEVMCWGDNEHGQLGDGTMNLSTIAVRVGSLTDAIDVEIGRQHSCALRATGEVACWGDDGSSQLGDGIGGAGSTVPVAVTGISAAVDIISGASHACAIGAARTFECWGLNEGGQLGDGTRSNAPSPVTISGLTGVVHGDGGGEHTCVVVAGPEVSCWGLNADGQLGDGSTTARLTPEAGMRLAGAVAVSAGEAHTCALLATGQATCWGDNGSGQLGDGTIMPSTTPTAIAAITDFAEISAGGGHTCGRRTGGEVLCWGRNTSGQLGDGTMVDQLTPTVVLDLSP